MERTHNLTKEVQYTPTSLTLLMTFWILLQILRKNSFDFNVFIVPFWE